MKTINFELSKRLNDLGLLDNIETEYKYNGEYIEWKEDINTDPEDYECDYTTFSINEGELLTNKDILRCKKTIKTLTLEEVIELLGKNMCQMELLYPNGGVWNLQIVLDGPNFKGTLIEVFEQFIEYLLDNNLITK